MAVEVLEALVEQLPALRAELWSAIGRLFLQASTSVHPLALKTTMTTKIAATIIVAAIFDVEKWVIAIHSTGRGLVGVRVIRLCVPPQLGDAPSAQTYFSHVSRLAAEDPSKAAQAKINE